MKKSIWLFGVFALVFSVIACTSNATAEGEGDTSAVEEISADIQAEKDKMTAELKSLETKLDARIASVSEEIESATQESKQDLEKQYEELLTKKKQLTQAMDKMGTDMGNDWKAFKQKVNDNVEKWEKEFSEAVVVEDNGE